MTLKEHIGDIREGLESNRYPDEAAVSQGIVLRLLCALGWPIFEIQTVIPQYKVKSRKVDFALCRLPSEPLVFIEVKQVGKIRSEEQLAEEQLFAYILEYDEVIPIAVLTDGQKLRFFHPMPIIEERCREQKVRELDFIKDSSEKIADCLHRYLNYESIRIGEAVEAIKEDYELVIQEKQIVTHLPEEWNKLMEHVPLQFRSIPPELFRVSRSPNGENDEVFAKATWKVTCMRWWGDKKKKPFPWEDVEEMISSSQLSLESILTSDVYERCVKYSMKNTRTAEKFDKWYKSYKNMSKRIGQRLKLSPEKVQQIIDEVRKEHNSTTREDNKNA